MAPLLTQREQRLVQALRAIVLETMEYSPIPHLDYDSFLPSELIRAAQDALGAYGANVEPSVAMGAPDRKVVA